jgi:hypothetical protein
MAEQQKIAEDGAPVTEAVVVVYPGSVTELDTAGEVDGTTPGAGGPGPHDDVYSPRTRKGG